MDLSRLETKIDKLIVRVGNIDVILASQHASFKEHMKKTDLLEKRLEPVRVHVSMMTGALKLLGSVSVLFSFAKLIKWI